MGLSLLGWLAKEYFERNLKTKNQVGRIITGNTQLLSSSEKAGGQMVLGHSTCNIHSQAAIGILYNI